MIEGKQSMPYHDPTYSGDAEYCINATGDCVAGDEVRFQRARFTGSYRKPKFAGFELVTGRIIRDSYGARKQQHTFTLLLPDGSTTCIKGRNLYRNGVWRRPWADESARRAALDEKHRRGEKARQERFFRREAERQWGWY